MVKNILFKSAFSLLTVMLVADISQATAAGKYTGCTRSETHNNPVTLKDTVPPKEVMDVVKTVIYSLNTFNIDAVADLYTPNAVVADDEPPYSWNGPTAGVQWVNAVEKVCKDNKLTRLKGKIATINIYQQSADNVYIVVPVSFTGDLPGGESFSTEGGFTFVLRMINGKWMIKSQVWLPRKGL
jgi:ketosteroid isomerase-like protein